MHEFCSIVVPAFAATTICGMRGLHARRRQPPDIRQLARLSRGNSAAAARRDPSGFPVRSDEQFGPVRAAAAVSFGRNPSVTDPVTFHSAPDTIFMR